MPSCNVRSKILSPSGLNTGSQMASHAWSHTQSFMAILYFPFFSIFAASALPSILKTGCQTWSKLFFHCGIHGKVGRHENPYNLQGKQRPEQIDVSVIDCSSQHGIPWCQQVKNRWTLIWNICDVFLGNEGSNLFDRTCTCLCRASFMAMIGIPYGSLPSNFLFLMAFWILSQL